MKTGAAILFTLLASANAFSTPMLATRAVATKKAPVKKAPVKAVKKAPVKAGKKAPEKTIAVKKAPVKKSLFAKKAAPEKAAPAAKQAPVKKSLFAKKAPAKAPVKASATKKAPVKKAPVKKAPVKKAPVRKAPVKKAPVKKFGSSAKKSPVKKVAPKAASKRSFSPSSKYIIFDGASKFKIKGISGGGNKKSMVSLMPPDLSDPSMQVKRDPAFFAAAAKTRLTKTQTEYLIDDGLTIIERKQKKDLPGFLSGSARSQIDESAIIGEIAGVDYFGLSADRFQLLFITVFGLFTLVGFLSGRIPA